MNPRSFLLVLFFFKPSCIFLLIELRCYTINVVVAVDDRMGRFVARVSRETTYNRQRTT